MGGFPKGNAREGNAGTVLQFRIRGTDKTVPVFPAAPRTFGIQKGSELG